MVPEDLDIKQDIKALRKYRNVEKVRPYRRDSKMSKGSKFWTIPTEQGKMVVVYKGQNNRQQKRRYEEEKSVLEGMGNLQ